MITLGTRSQLVPVRFEFTRLTATSVYVAGAFNQWQPKPGLCTPQEAVTGGRVGFGKDMQKAGEEIQNSSK
jgi:hypothetical protein